ncbi:MAG TPA: DR2241 family protein [Verrucomicrobiales bacterium]|nr:DR2241 family protein [Verrucomicrobiales bacterium]
MTDHLPPVIDPSPRSLLAALEAWLSAGGSRVGEAVILRGPDGSFRIRHHADAAEPVLTIHRTPEAAREVAKYDAAGEFRPLKSAPTLIRGWEIMLPDTLSLMQALDFLYPAALANWVRWLDGEAMAPPLREALGRQTGIYRVTALLRDGEAEELVAGLCREKCLRHVMWPLTAGHQWTALPPEKQSAPRDGPGTGCPLPLLCLDPCPLLIGGARSAVKRRMKAESVSNGN